MSYTAREFADTFSPAPKNSASGNWSFFESERIARLKNFKGGELNWNLRLTVDREGHGAKACDGAEAQQVALREPPAQVASVTQEITFL
jgi:hypothetical protein